MKINAIIIEGLFSVDDDQVNFNETTDLTVEAISSVLENVRKRVLRLFARRGYLDKDDIEDMIQWKNGGFSLDASVRIHAHDREGLERLIRYFARPVFASERLSFMGNGKLLYLLPKPSMKGETFLHLDPLELIDKLAALIPSRRKHQRFYHGVLASHSKWRKKITADDLKSLVQATKCLEIDTFNLTGNLLTGKNLKALMSLVQCNTWILINNPIKPRKRI